MEVKAGTIPDGWISAPLGQFCGRITTGKLDANAMVSDGDYPFFTCAKERYRIDKYAFDCESLLVSGNGANVGYVHYYNGKFNAYQRTYVLSDFTADVHFLRLFLDRNLQERIRVEVNAGNTPYITMGTLTGMGVTLPINPAEQRAIAQALSDVDGLLGGLDRLIAKKRDLKQAAMQQLLTAQTRLPGFHGEWEVKAISKLGGIQTGPFGTLLKAHEYSGSEGVPLISVGEVGVGRLRITEDTPRVPKKVIRRLPQYVLRKGDIVFGRKGAVNRSALISEAEDGWFLGSDGIRLRPHEGCHSPYLAWQFQRHEVQAWLLQNAIGTTMASLNQGILNRVQIPCAPLPEQTAIAEVLTEMDAELAALEQRREKTRALKQAMMQELLTGRTRLV